MDYFVRELYLLRYLISIANKHFNFCSHYNCDFDVCFSTACQTWINLVHINNMKFSCLRFKRALLIRFMVTLFDNVHRLSTTLNTYVLHKSMVEILQWLLRIVFSVKCPKVTPENTSSQTEGRYGKF